eukprot:g5661.t1
MSLSSSSSHVQQRRTSYQVFANRSVLHSRQYKLVSKCFSAEYSDVETQKPETSKEAITEGLKLHRDGRYHEAVKILTISLDLPGSAAKLYRDKSPGPSQGEKIAAFYNIACCYSALEESRKALVAMAACLEVGYRDFKNMLTDSDLAHVRKDPRFLALLDRYKSEDNSSSKN